MQNLLKNKTVMGGVVAAIILGLVYYVWSSQGAAPLLTDTSAGTSPASQEILTTLGQLRTIKLDPSLFSDPVFMSLSDFGVTIPPQNAGRRNPFEPVGSAAPATPATPAKPAGQ